MAYRNATSEMISLCVEIMFMTSLFYAFVVWVCVRSVGFKIVGSSSATKWNELCAQQELSTKQKDRECRWMMKRNRNRREKNAHKIAKWDNNTANNGERQMLFALLTHTVCLMFGMYFQSNSIRTVYTVRVWKELTIRLKCWFLTEQANGLEERTKIKYWQMLKCTYTFASSHTQSPCRTTAARRVGEEKNPPNGILVNRFSWN